MTVRSGHTHDMFECISSGPKNISSSIPTKNENQLHSLNKNECRVSINKHALSIKGFTIYDLSLVPTLSQNFLLRIELEGESID